MLGHQALVRVEIQGRAVQRAARALDHPQHQRGAGAGGQLGQGLRLSPRHVDGARMVAGKRLAPFGQAVAQARAEYLALGIAAQQRLGQNHQART